MTAPPDAERAAHHQDDPPPHARTTGHPHDNAQGCHPPASQQRSWWDVHQFLSAAVQQANCGPIPAAGTPAWCALSDRDPRKLLAVALDGEHHVLRVETAQNTMAGASKAVAEAADWPAVARTHLRHANAVRNGSHIPRRQKVPTP